MDQLGLGSRQQSALSGAGIGRGRVAQRGRLDQLVTQRAQLHPANLARWNGWRFSLSMWTSFYNLPAGVVPIGIWQA